MAPPSFTIRAVDLLRSVPWDGLPSSALVDLLLFSIGEKPAVRLRPHNAEGIARLVSWCVSAGLFSATDSDGYACVARSQINADQVIDIDRRFEPHEYDLGLALGYPECCCRAIASLGEGRIDGQADQAARWQYQGRFRRINPKGYCEGLSLISHVPCCPQCRSSLAIANQARAFVLAHPQEPVLRRLWRSPLVTARGRGAFREVR